MPSRRTSFVGYSTVRRPPAYGSHGQHRYCEERMRTQPPNCGTNARPPSSPTSSERKLIVLVSPTSSTYRCEFYVHLPHVHVRVDIHRLDRNVGPWIDL